MGTQIRAATTLGTFDDGAHYSSVASGNPSDPYRENDFEEDIFGAVRVLRRGQVALLVPIVETQRHEQGLGEFGGGIGDVNLSAPLRLLPRGAVALRPRHRRPRRGDRSDGDAAPDAQNTEQAARDGRHGGRRVARERRRRARADLRPVALQRDRALRVAARVADGGRGGDSESETLAPQFVTLAGAAYTSRQRRARSRSSAPIRSRGSGDAQRHAPAPDSARRIALVSVSGVYPLSDRLRLRASLFPQSAAVGARPESNGHDGAHGSEWWGWS